MEPSSSSSVPFIVTTSSNSQQQQQTIAFSAESYEEVFKEITKKLYGDEQFAELIDPSQANIIYDTGEFRTDQGVAFLTQNGAALPPGTIVVQRKVCQDKDGRLWSMDGEPLTLEQVSVTGQPQQQQNQQQQQHPPALPAPTTGNNAAEGQEQERWFQSEEVLSWTTSKIARYNPTQKVFRCVDCDFVGFLSRVAEHWLGNHASLRVFQCPRCPYTSAWARCVRMHLTRQHGETITDNSMWKENPVLEEVTKYLGNLKSGVEARVVENESGDRRYICPYCPYTTDRRDLYNRHENIHREEKPFQCYVCDKQFNRADHVKKHFTRMHRDHQYDINKIKKHFAAKNAQGVVPYSKMAKKSKEEAVLPDPGMETISLHLDGGSGTTVTIPQIAYFSPSGTGESQQQQVGSGGPLQGMVGVGGTKKEGKPKGNKVKKKPGEKMYTCSYCPWQGVDNWCLKRHLNTHIKPYLCALCDYKAARSERLATHVLKVHNKRVCHKCSFLADDTESLSQHIQDAHQNPLVKTGFNCNVCQEYFELRADLEAHAILEHQKVIVQCDLCDFRTTDELSMEAHLREKHNLQPGMGAVAAAAAAAQSMANNGTGTFQIPIQSQSQQIHLPDPLTLDLINSADGTLVTTDSITFQADQGGIIPKMEPGTTVANSSTPNMLSHSANSTEAGTMEVHGLVDQNGLDEALLEEEPETLCDRCGIEFGDEASLKIHEKLHIQDENNNKENVEKKRNLQRNYVCSTCSYTAPTKNLMMQHQRAHNGLELVCQAEGCLFSTPFDNTLKEHILADHALEPNVRCPHCGLRVPSMNAFTYHWRSHHKGVCSLCVNLYRIKFGIKENDLGEIVGKSMLQLLNEEFEGKDKPVIQIDEGKQEEQNSSFSSVATSDGDITDCLNNNNVLEEAAPPSRKRAKLDLDFSPVTSALERRRARESLCLIPNFAEVLVTPVLSNRQLNPQKLKGPSVRRNYHSCLRYLSRASSAWLFRHPRPLEIKKRCHHLGCVGTRTFSRRSSFLLHKLWQHSKKPSVQCDSCDRLFPQMYQALIHKIREHEPEPEAREHEEDDHEDHHSASSEFHEKQIEMEVHHQGADLPVV